MTFFSCGEDSHDLAVMSVGPDALGPEANRVGMYYFASQLDTYEDLQEAHRYLMEKGANVVGTSDHGVSQSVYLTDPDGNELEIYYERPRSEWPTEGNPFAGTTALNL